MIIGIGIDMVEISRFTLWQTFSRNRLERIFSAQEIDYCLAAPIKSAERFAARFAAREAFFKALGHGQYQQVPFLTMCKKVSVVNGVSGVPFLQVDWQFFPGLSDQLSQPVQSAQCGHSNGVIEVFITLTHTRSVATAMVLLQK